MFRYVHGALVVLALWLSPSFADSDAKTKADKPNEVIALFHDGTKVRMLFLQETLDIATKYGKLIVPTRDVRRIDLGFRLDDETAQKVDEAVKNLGSPNFQLREKAAKDLTALGRQAYPALVNASKGSDLDLTRRIEDILKAIRTKVPAEQLRSRTDDLVHTTTFTIAGRIEVPVLKAKTQHFGEVQLQLTQLRLVQSAEAIGEVRVSVDAAVYGSNNVQWMDTGFVIQPDVPLVITASGEVDLYGNQGGGAISGPAGNRNYGRGRRFLPGALIARIGEDGGEEVLVGRRFSQTPNVEGKLYLRIMGLPGSNGANGTYKVHIRSGPN